MSALLRRHADRTPAEAVPLHTWLDTFRTVLRATPDAEVPTLRATAQRLPLSTRTLQRRLGEHRTTWPDELQTVRSERALRLLTSTDMTLGSVARHAGYAGPGGLHRAVRRWTGQPVAAFRAHSDDDHPTEASTVRLGSWTRGRHTAEAAPRTS
ncbi:helix-turn-helix domain-containing protein [Streptomyces showdoensis]|uniref:helix-turn-helix domain-containing protein n=1 Tax=Streptomyces showdoensis TaxID=68268 RepID=UPI0013F4DB1E|nr:helix-turn-helix domain-containing protein [Streptomyces showdoensis]